MGALIAGILLWALAHLLPSVTPEARAGLQTRLGSGAKGLAALIILGGLVLMIVGWRSTVPVPVYDPPAWGRDLNMALMFVAVLFFGAAKGNSRIRQWVRHPMLTGMALWAAGHLSANGDNRSLVLFGGLGLWALLSIVTISRREGPWRKPADMASFARELVSIVIAGIIYGALTWGHVYFAGVPLTPA